MIVTQDQLETFAQTFIKTLKVGDIIFLKGTLGAGKSTLVRAAIASVLLKDEPIPSPTFTLVQLYDTKVGQIAHFDLYRIENNEELHELGLEELFSQSISFVEWPDRITTYEPTHIIELLETDFSENRFLSILK
jgi:tRNA threonylcarbamoyladenosine biosynthesis protein TsaE